MAHEEQDYIDGWRTYSDWIDSLRNTSDTIAVREADGILRETFTACHTNFERFELVWNNKGIRDELDKLCSQDIARLAVRRSKRLSYKSADESKRMRELGNKSFKDGRHLEALRRYTEAVRYGPYPSPQNPDDTLALALANRSAALYSLCRYRLCLLDIDLALRYGYPEANKFKLLIRKVKCLHILSVWANDVENIKEDLRNLVKNPGTKDYIKTEINNMFEFIETTQPENLDKAESDVEDESAIKISNVNKTLPQAADCVEMSYDPDKGRYLLINKDVSYGRLLIAEDPFVCNLAPSKRNLHCYNCFAKLHSCGLSCENCVQVLYCSIECLSSNKQIHSYECNKLLDFQELLGVAYLVTHIMFKIDFNLTSIPVQTKKAIENKSLDEVIEISHSIWPDLVYRNDYASVLSLMDHANDYDYDELIGYTLTAAYLVTMFMKQSPNSKFKAVSTNESQLVIGSVVLRHLMQLQTNLISILNQNLQGLISVGHAISDIQEHPIGIGLYPTVSLLNHSCQPNIFSIFHYNKFVVRSSSGLEVGTEINYCYGPSYNRMSKIDRQKRLKEQYFFTCNCDCCENDKENVSRALVCPNCKGPIIFNLDYTHKCMECKKENIINVTKYLEQVDRLKESFEKLRTDEKDDQKKLDELNKIESNLSELIHWRNPIFVEIKSQKVECADNQEDLESALKYCKEVLDLSDKTHGENSFESIMTQLKYINLDWQRLYYIAEESDSDNAKQSARSELKSLLSKVGATRGKLKDLLVSTNILGAESTFDSELKFLSDISTNINKYLANLDAPSSSAEAATKE